MTNSKLNELKNNINQFINDVVISQSKDFQLKTLEHLDSYKIHYNSWLLKIPTIEDKYSLLIESSNLNRVIEQNLHSENKRMEAELHFALYDLLKDKISENIDSLDSYLILDQEPQHFNFSEPDSTRIILSKKIKRISFSISSKTFHLFKGKDTNYTWKRKVPLKNITTHYLLNLFLNIVLKNIEKYIEVIGKGYIDFFNNQRDLDKLFVNQQFSNTNNDNEIGVEQSHIEFIERIDALKTEFQNSFNEFALLLNTELNNTFISLQNGLSIVGTVQLSKSHFSNEKISKKLSAQETKFNKSKENYKYFISAIFDRKEYYQDLQWFTLLLVANSYNINKYASSFLFETIKPIILAISHGIDKSKTSLLNSSDNLFSAIDAEKDFLRKKLDQELIPVLMNQIASQEIDKVFGEYSESLKINLNEFEKDYVFLKPKHLNFRIKQDQLERFSPKEIIDQIIIQKINSSIKKIDGVFENNISKVNTSVISIERIIEFSLDSAKIKFDKDDSSQEESIKIAIEGLQRANSKIDNFYKELENIFEELSVSLHSNIQNVLEDLISLSNIDGLLKIKIKVSREKALHEAKQKLQTAYTKSLKWFYWLKNKSINLFSLSKEKLVGISSKVGLSNSNVELSEAMADYLVRVSDSLEKLPYVYQRLFSSDQLTDERIFIGRDDELAKLEKAINYWCNNQTSSVMIIGEKGSGTSSLINIAIQKQKLCSHIYRKEFSGTIYKEEDLLLFLIDLLTLNSIKSTEELIETINNFDERRIVIIENIEDFFLRIVDGFNALSRLLEIISSTNEKILWITTCNIFSWTYLNHVVNIKDFFIFNTVLNKLDPNFIENIIISRHNISGYDLEFIPSAEVEKQKSFIKMDDKKKQVYLRNNYFDELNKLTSNNIAVALFLWLRSIVSADDGIIKVASDLEFNYSFLNKLSTQKLFSLMAIMLHDGLSQEEHSLIFNMDMKSSQLLFATLSDDGIIFKRGKNYKINFQLYKPIINLLKDKNILH